mmetsp:Transcript_43886/g.92337  ORF Transcript_43886/g.92337 Transcript_43886/m.92337 type:complete len:377 (-) Transcript_43886:171-1301(-)|eukprot:CAMPEP_0183726530 /NCGR_PEP_ID=MMETSP0737-20130205/23475_1 /TAXON_ID=385413 /ORGANISM="Thalassiosira miniscula, Strain CCMP1093" /LENGTH=376 /DNA_ID=CAMNT_0025957903 /DNA_START=61 /DNA_END=1191 /DNA_ORIENTATION=-
MTNRTAIKIAVSGAAGNIGYALLPLLASGYVFESRPIELRLLEIPNAMKSLAGTRMELLDCAFPTLTDVICTVDPLIAFDGVDIIVLVGGFPRKKGMARKDLIQANTKIFTSMGQAINEAALPHVKVLVVANPANTNCLVALKEASRIPSKNFCGLSFLDHQRAKGQIAHRLGVSANRVKNVTIWGNHSETQYPDALTDGYCIAENGEKTPLRSLLSNDLDWVTNDFISIVQNRGKAVIEVRGNSSAMSAAMGTADCLKTWLVTGTKEGDTVSMAVYNDKGYYGVQEDIVFSFPCECRNGEWYVKEGLQLSDYAQQKLKITEKELLEEREAAEELASGSRKRSISIVSSSPSLITLESDMSFATSVESGPYLTSRI